MKSNEKDFYIESKDQAQFVFMMWQALTPISSNGVKASC